MFITITLYGPFDSGAMTAILKAIARARRHVTHAFRLWSPLVAAATHRSSKRFFKPSAATPGRSFVLAES